MARVRLAMKSAVGRMPPIVRLRPVPFHALPLLVFWALGVPSASAQEDAAGLARGQQYLERIAASWNDRLPIERLIGTYYARKWVGFTRISIRPDPEGEPARFEWVLESSLDAPGRVVRSRQVARLGPALEVRSWVAESVDNGKTTTLRVRMSDTGGSLEIRNDLGTNVIPVAAGPGLTPGKWMLSVFGLPETEDVSLREPGSPAAGRLHRLPGTRPPPFGVHPTELAGWEFAESSPILHVYATAQGEFVEAVSVGSPVRWVLIPEAEFGKDRDEALDLAEPVRVVVELLRAAKRGDRAAAASCFDFVAAVKVMFPDFARQDRVTPEAARRQLETAWLESWMPSMAAGLCEDRLIEDLFGPRMECRSDGEGAEVAIPESTRFRLWREGGAGGRWRVYDVQSL